MKKIIALILVVLIAFSTLTIGASAFTADTEGVWVGVDNNVVYADPGKTVVIPIGVAANLSDEDFTEKNIDKASAVMAIPFSLETDANSPIQSVALSDAAKAAGATYEANETVNGVVDGTITLPLAALNGNESMVVLNVEVKMDENWEVVDYAATQPVTVKVSEKYIRSGVVITDKDANQMFASQIPQGFTIKATPYKANFIEKAIEWVKSKIRGFYVLFQTLNNYLLSDPLEAPDWVKQEQNRAERDKAAAEAELEVA